ncbi:helix-turn-helix transcriptional regulator [Rudaea sp.]|uniref:AraC family transcriptional regulator n=1 Tax=Rudaea sp. TaxID=2136325 RepID=UPI002ED20205
MQRSKKSIDYQYVPRPIAVLADDYPSGFHDPMHRHVRAQLVYAISGVTILSTQDASYVAPPQRAIWIPPGVEHEVRCRGRVQIRTLYVAADAAPDLPQACQVFEVSNLLRELILAAAEMPVEYALEGREARVMALILDEIRVARRIPLHVPMPINQRLARICQTILADPAQHDVLDAWASAAAMGRRTFTRTFRRETGMSFATWRQQVRLMDALSRIATGHSVTSAALDVGYNSPSAFAAMFRRTFGVSPTHYVISDATHPESIS